MGKSKLALDACLVTHCVYSETLVSNNALHSPEAHGQSASVVQYMEHVAN